MPLHLIKLCVGCDTVADLDGWIKQKLREKKKRGQKPEHIHTTRMVPKRAQELIGGGSLYWVIRGQIMCREGILDIRPFTAPTWWASMAALYGVVLLHAHAHDTDETEDDRQHGQQAEDPVEAVADGTEEKRGQHHLHAPGEGVAEPVVQLLTSLQIVHGFSSPPGITSTTLVNDFAI